MMVSLSMGVLQCNLFANVSTVAGESHFNSLCGYSLACGHWDSPQGSSGHLAHLLGIRQDSQQSRGADTAVHCPSTQIWGHSKC